MELSYFTTNINSYRDFLQKSNADIMVSTSPRLKLSHKSSEINKFSKKLSSDIRELQHCVPCSFFVNLQNYITGFSDQSPREIPENFDSYSCPVLFFTNFFHWRKK